MSSPSNIIFAGYCQDKRSRLFLLAGTRCLQCVIVNKVFKVESSLGLLNINIKCWYVTVNLPIRSSLGHCCAEKLHISMRLNSSSTLCCRGFSEASWSLFLLSRFSLTLNVFWQLFFFLFHVLSQQIVSNTKKKKGIDLYSIKCPVSFHGSTPSPLPTLSLMSAHYLATTFFYIPAYIFLLVLANSFWFIRLRPMMPHDP